MMANFAKLSELSTGDRLIADGGFTCLDEGEQCRVHRDERGLFVTCRETETGSKHYLDGQADDGEIIIGFSLAPRERADKDRLHTALRLLREVYDVQRPQCDADEPPTWFAEVDALAAECGFDLKPVCRDQAAKGGPLVSVFDCERCDAPAGEPCREAAAATPETPA